MNHIKIQYCANVLHFPRVIILQSTICNSKDKIFSIFTTETVSEQMEYDIRICDKKKNTRYTLLKRNDTNHEMNEPFELDKTCSD